MEHSTPPVDDPRQWSSAKKVRVALILALMVLSFTYLSTAFALSSASLQRHFGASVEVVTLGLSLYVLGFALGPLLMGPLAQGNGKRPVYVYSWIFFSAFCFVISESDNLPVILTFRLLASIAGASALNNVPASFGDMTFPGRNAPFFCLYAVSAFAGPALGGLVGAFVDSRAGWRWNLRVQSILVTVITIISILFVPETDHPKLQRSHQSRYVAEEYNADLGPMKQGAAVGFLGTLIRSARNFCSTMVNNIRLPFSWLLTDRVVLAISIYTSLLYATIFGFFIIIPYTFATIRAFQPESVGLIYISLLIGFSLAALNYLGAQEQFNRRTREKLASATIPPETNMIHAIYGCSLAPIGLFIFAWTAPYPQIHWIAPAIGITLFCAGSMAAFTSLIPYLVVYGGPSAPSILAAAGFCRSALATAFPLFTRQMCERLTVQGAVSLLAGLALLLTPLPFLFYVFGGRLREQQTERKREAASAFTAAEVSQSPEKNPKANNSTSSSNPTDGPGVTLLFHEPDSLTASTIHSSTPVGIVT